MKNKSNYIVSGVSFILFITLIILIKTVDVGNTGVGDTKIGLYALNHAANSFLGENAAWYKLTEITGVLSLAAAGIFALMGVCELICRKSIIKVDKELLSLGGLYVITGIIYVFFEKVIINYRPLIEAGKNEAEASFPSSHTVLVIVIMGSILMIIDKYIKNPIVLQIVRSVCSMTLIVTVLGRMLSGVHWITDIIGGVLISVCLLSLFRALTKE